MNLPIVAVDPMDARRAFIEYRTAVRESLDREAETWDDRKRAALALRREADQAIMTGYRQISLGHRLIDIGRVIREGGEDKAFRPKLAISRADQKRVHLMRWRDGTLSFSAIGQSHNSNHTDPRTDLVCRLPAGTLSAITGAVNADAMVPLIPPRFRPVQLERFHLLWEADWNPVRPPLDPALLRHLGGGLYVVLATWDLTDIERAVLSLHS